MPFEYQTKFSPVFRTPVNYWTGIQIIVWIQDFHLNTRQVKVCYSDPHCTGLVHFSDLECKCKKCFLLPTGQPMQLITPEIVWKTDWNKIILIYKKNLQNCYHAWKRTSCYPLIHVKCDPWISALVPRCVKLHWIWTAVKYATI